MVAIVTRQTAGTGATVKNSPLTNAEVDTNFIEINGVLVDLVKLSVTVSNTAPSSPILHQLWFDGVKKLLYVYNGTIWKNVTKSKATLFTTGGTLTVLPETKYIEAILIGGGGGGGGGRRGGDGSAKAPGGGGAGGGGVRAVILKAAITSDLTIAVGVGGAGGACGATDNSNGLIGASGTATTVSISSALVLTALGGAGGNFGTGSSSTGAPVKGTGMFRGGDGSAQTAFGTDPRVRIGGHGFCGGGGGGGVLGFNQQYQDGSDGGRGSGGITPGAFGPGDGQDGSTPASVPNGRWLGGSGGGGGSPSSTVLSGAGGNGGFPGGGGGGAASCFNGVGGKSGGNGANGLAVIIEYF
jgi:hypothetical protein